MPKIKPYVVGLIKQNIAYILGVFLLVVLTVVMIKLGFDRVAKANKDERILTREVKELQTKFDLLNSVVPSGADLDEYIRLLNGLIPNAEDYFSIIKSLEVLSQKSGFIITSYNVGLNAKIKDRFRLAITGIGDSSAFLSFLENYNFGGGRLITSDKIELNPQVDTAIKVNLTFYSKKVVEDLAADLQINEKTLSEIASLIPKVGVSLKEEENVIDFSYPKKSNPF